LQMLGASPLLREKKFGILYPLSELASVDCRIGD
jgi:hypothetical protein